MCVFVVRGIGCSVHTLDHTCVHIRICFAYSTVAACPCFAHTLSAVSHTLEANLPRAREDICTCSGLRRLWSRVVSKKDRIHLHVVSLYVHTYLSSAHTTKQCMTMCQGTVDGKKFAKGIHAHWQATAPVKNPRFPSHSMLIEWDGRGREGIRTT